MGYLPPPRGRGMTRVLNIIFRCVWASIIIAAAVSFGAVYGWHKHGLVAAIALGFVGLVVGAPFGYSPRGFFELLATMLLS
ncbi:hypothetical protein A9Z06_17075 [Rhizobium sp. YK2]|nr:hypothetical protein A9Z06_17075 [Rhizobium sp. YK2]